MDEILWCYHSNETSSAVLSHGTIYFLCSSNIWICGWNLMVWPFKWILPPPPPPYFLMVLFSRCLVCSVNFWDCRRNPMVWPFQWNFFSYVVLLHGTIYLVCSPNVWDCGRNPIVWPSKWNLERQYLHEVLFAFLKFCKIKVCFLFIILTLASWLSEQVKKPCQFCIVS